MAEACGRQARSDALPYRRRGRQNREWRTECPGYGSCCCLPPARAPHSRRRWEGSTRRFHGSIGKAGGEQHHDGIETQAKPVSGGKASEEVARKQHRIEERPQRKEGR